MTRDPSELARVERAVVAELIAGVLRHDVLNKVMAIRNAEYYLRSKVNKTDLWQSDRRIPFFFQLS